MRDKYKLKITQDEWMYECGLLSMPEKTARYLIKKYCNEHGISDVEDWDIKVCSCSDGNILMSVDERILGDNDYYVNVSYEFDSYDGISVVTFMLDFYAYEPQKDAIATIQL